MNKGENKTKRRLVIAVIFLLLALGLMGGTPITPVPSAECAGDCATQRYACWVQAREVYKLCLAITNDAERCWQEQEENYRSCQGLCW